jgi:hypothetical protein
MRAWVLRHRCEGTWRVRLSGPTRPGGLALQATQLFEGDLPGGAGWRVTSSVESSGRAGAGSWRSTSTENEQNHRPPWWVRGGRADTAGVGRFHLPLVHHRRHQRQAPVEREPLPAAVRPQRGFLGGCRVHREPIRPHHRRGHCSTTSAAASARRRADRRPDRPAPIDARDLGSCPAPGRRSPHPGFTTMIRRPVTASAASRCSTPNRARRSRCSTTIPPTRGSARIFRSVARSPFTPDPTPVTVASSVIPRSPASCATRPACRSTSSRWSADETQQ